MDVDERTAELAANLRDISQRIAAAAQASGRSPDDVTLIAVTKTWPAADVRRLHALGLRDVGENRDQEAAPKAAELADLDLRWHFIGQLQSNKARSVARYAHMVHSVDRASLVDALARTGTPLDICLQLSVDGDPARGGVLEADLLALAARVEAPLRLRGVMAVAPLGVEPATAFAEVRRLHELLLAHHPQATVRCIGMSDDFEAAIAQGATHVRIGSALLGSRPHAR